MKQNEGTVNIKLPPKNYTKIDQNRIFRNPDKVYKKDKINRYPVIFQQREAKAQAYNHRSKEINGVSENKTKLGNPNPRIERNGKRG